MDSNWICECITLNLDEKCPFCALINKPHNTIASKDIYPASNTKKPELRKAMELYSNQLGKLIPNQKTFEAIIKNFNPKQDIAIIGVVGTIGTGKSTWLNTILYHCEDDSKVSIFEVGHRIQSQTEDLWVYPYPLYYKSNKEVQILLIDMEGMQAIKEGMEKSIISLGLKRLYSFVLNIASIFTIHTDNRIDATTIETLLDGYRLHKIIKEKIDIIQTPKIILLVKDANENSLKIDDNGSDYISYLDGIYHLEVELKNSMEILPKFHLTREFKESKGSNYRLLEGSEYLKGVGNVIDRTHKFRKINPRTMQGIKVAELVKLFADLDHFINSKKFEILCIGPSDNEIMNLIEPIKKIIFENYLEICNISAKSVDTSLSIKEFQHFLEEFQEDTKKNFIKSCEEAIHLKLEDCLVLQHQIQEFEITLKNTKALAIFEDRKASNPSVQKKLQEIEDARIALEEMKNEMNLQGDQLATKDKNQKNIENISPRSKTLIEKIKREANDAETKVRNEAKRFVRNLKRKF